MEVGAVDGGDPGDLVPDDDGALVDDDAQAPWDPFVSAFDVDDEGRIIELLDAPPGTPVEVTDDGGATWDSAIVGVNLNGDKVAVYAAKRFRGLKDELDEHARGPGLLSQHRVRPRAPDDAPATPKKTKRRRRRR